jgi:cupin 2 domain-containing protein
LVELSAGSLLAHLPLGPQANERVETLLDRADLRIERIISAGQATPEGEWYDQAADEWVLLVSGRARLKIEGERAERELGPGDYLHLPARCRHRVAWTDPDQPTVWLAIHLAGAQSSS